MPESFREEINKKEIGARIKRLRKEAGLRQWQLAEMVGATQPAIHMYERGVLPEPKRLLEIARIGNTTVEWILTGRHWKDGSDEMHRVSDEIYQLAFQLKEYGAQEQEALREAMDVIGNALDSIKEQKKEDIPEIGAEEMARQLKGFSEGTRMALTSALAVHQAVAKAVMAEATDRLRRSGLATAGRGAGVEPAGQADTAAGDRMKGLGTMRSSSIEAIRGNIFKLDGSMMVINDIMKDKDLRAEFAETLARLRSKLQSKKGKLVRLRKTQRRN